MSTKTLCAALFAVFIAVGPAYAAEALPDLVVDSVKWEYQSGHGTYKGKVHPDDNIIVKVVVRNIGQAAAGPFRVQLEIRWVENQRIKSSRYLKDVSSLAPRASKTVVFEKKRVIFGEYMFTARADYKNKVNEYNEANNEKIGSNMPVTDPPAKKADLVVSLYSPDASRHIGRKVLLRGKVENHGKGTSSPCKLRLKCKGKKTKTANVPALRYGQSYKFEFKHRWSVRGKKKCEAFVDSGQKVNETNENNNKATTWITIK